jgi:hypothetical protein
MKRMRRSAVFPVPVGLRIRAPSHGVSRWSIHGPDGLLAGTLETSRALRLMDVGEDYVLAVERDEYDVERVVLFPLTRSR